MCVLELHSVVAANLLNLHFNLILGLPSEVLEDLLDLRFIIKKELLGNTVISKKKSYDHARSIYVMHSNERGECVRVPSS